MTRLSVWRIRNPLLRALAMWFSVLVCLPLYLAVLLVWGFAWAVFAAVGSLLLITPLDAVRHCRSLPWRNIGRAMLGKAVTW